MKDHKPSPHMVGEQPPAHVSTRLALSSLLVVIAAIVLLNVVFPEPPMVSCDRPAPAANQK